MPQRRTPRERPSRPKPEEHCAGGLPLIICQRTSHCGGPIPALDSPNTYAPMYCAAPTIAKGRVVDPRERMNKLEGAYADELDLLKRAGVIKWWAFEAIKLRLADWTQYIPDFFIVNEHDELEVREVKGHWEDDARVKIKVASELYPFRFIAVTRNDKGWEYEIFERGARK